jgi:phospholipid/cholesterol/gamma-HCH transport system substrate-binding protein
MESRAYALITGLFVIGLAAGIIAWASWLAQEPLERKPYRVISTVPVTGLNPQAQVRYRGMGVGRVTAIRLDPKDRQRILIDIEVNSDIPVTRGTYAQLGMEGITGIAYVHLLDESRDAAPAPRGPGGVAELPLKPSFFDTMADGAEGAVRDARELIAGLNALLAPENRKRVGSMLEALEKVTVNLEAATGKLPRAVARAEAWLGEENLRLARESLERVNDAAKNLPEITGEAERLLAETRRLVVEVGKLSAETRELVGEIGKLSAEAQKDTLPQVNALAESADRGAQRVGRLAGELERNPDSVLWGRRAGRPGPGEPGFE